MQGLKGTVIMFGGQRYYVNGSEPIIDGTCSEADGKQRALVFCFPLVFRSDLSPLIFSRKMWLDCNEQTHRKMEKDGAVMMTSLHMHQKHATANNGFVFVIQYAIINLELYV